MRITQFVKYSWATYIQLKAKFRFAINRELKDLVKNNSIFKNIHKGERCFILGNGPSLKDEDLSSLENEYVFTVNKISKHPQFAQLKTNYHFWADPVFFKELYMENEEDKDLLKTFFSIKTPNNNPVCFLPEYGRKMAKKNGIEEELNVHYYCTQLPFRDNEKQEIDFSKVTFGFDTVVQWAISMAIYMGFKEIYLLGCDMTFIIGLIQTYLDESNDFYAYAVNEEEKKFAKENILKGNGLEKQFISAAKMLHLYEELKKYCDKRGIKLVNLSSKTIISSLPRRRLVDILKKI